MFNLQLTLGIYKAVRRCLFCQIRAFINLLFLFIFYGVECEEKTQKKIDSKSGWLKINARHMMKLHLEAFSPSGHNLFLNTH